MPIDDPSAWVNAFDKFTDILKHKLVQSLITVGLLFVGFVLYFAVQTGSLQAGMRELTTSRETRQQEAIQAKAERLQREIVAARDASTKIQGILKQVLDGESDDAIRIRLFAFHNGEQLLSGGALIRYDIVAGYAERGRSVGELEANLPINNFSSTLPALIAGECRMIEVNELVDTGAKMRMQQLGIVESLTCPVRDSQTNHLLGAVGISWDEPIKVSESPTFTETKRRLQAAADAIGWIYSTIPKSDAK